MKKWCEKSGQEVNVVISTRVRSAYNLGDYPLPIEMTIEQRERVEQAVRDAVVRGDSFIFNNPWFISFDDINQNEAVFLMERRLVSSEFTLTPSGRGLLLTQGETVLVMISEEDYLRTQAMCEGLDLEGVYEMVDRVDTLLGESLHFAFDKGLGYPTQCPTNLGIGMRASLTLHPSVLQESGAMRRVVPSLLRLGLVICGTYGEGSEPVRTIYQLSNQVALGLSEQSVIVNLKSTAGQLIVQERVVRTKLVKTVEAQDQVFRSTGILKNTRILSSDEFMRPISYVRTGVAAGFPTRILYDTVNSLIVQVQPITMMPARRTTIAERDVLRASIISQRLNVA